MAKAQVATGMQTTDEVVLALSCSFLACFVFDPSPSLHSCVASMIVRETGIFPIDLRQVAIWVSTMPQSV